MMIDHFSTFPHGGAGTAARRLHERLVARGVPSRFNYWRDQDQQELDPSYRQLSFAQPRRSSLSGLVLHQLDRRRRRVICRHYDRHVAKRPGKHELFSIPWSLQRSTVDFETLGSDIVHLHWMSFFIDYPSFFQSIPDDIPIVWSFHDMNPLTGGCHYSDGCSRFLVGCGNCPQVANSGPDDVSRHAFRDKQRALRNKQIHIVTPNQWLADLAGNSAIFPPQTRFHQIRLGLDENTFQPIDRNVARKELGLPVDGPLIAFGAEDVNNYRKGFHHLFAALRRVRRMNPDIQCLVFGNGKLVDDQAELPPMVTFGFVDDPLRQRLIYSAADLFVLPSREDNQPQTGLEAMACGTPVIAFRAGGIPEYVLDGETGLLAPVGDELALAEHIIRLLDDDWGRKKLSVSARKLIERNHTADRQAREYMELYRNIIRAALPLQAARPAPSRKAA
jgi:glycosyltransferase involved in cell wall biosynthesis